MLTTCQIAECGAVANAFLAIAQSNQLEERCSGMDISRRALLTGSLATVAVVGVGATAARGASIADAEEQGGQWSWSVPPEPVADEDIAETYECEICVVGAGNAGNSAALYAAMHGVNVVVLQKEATTCNNGQSTAYFRDWKNEETGTTSANGAGFADGSIGVSSGVPQQEWEISSVLQSYADLTGGITNLALVRRHILASNDAIMWLASTVTDPAATFSNSTTLTPNRVFWNAEEDDSGVDRIILNPSVVGNWRFNVNCAEMAQNNGAVYLFSTPARQLVTDASGAVTGVIGQREDGSYVKVSASRGVILCCGDISHDEEMLRCYCPKAVGLTPLGVMGTNTGDGTKMGLWVGAAIEDAPTNVQYHLDLLSPQPFKGVPWLTVNIRGERFTNENQDYGDITNAFVLQPDHTVYQIIDSHLLDNISAYTRAFYPSSSQESVDDAVEHGTGFVADSISELAEEIGLDAEKLVATVDRYNSMVDAGEDTDYGVDPEILKLNGIKEPPFYAFKYTSGLIIACVGLKSDEYMRVLDEQDEPIVGLYAAGNAQGSFFGHGYDHELGGWSLGRAKVGGILAVKSAMGTIDEPIE